MKELLAVIFALFVSVLPAEATACNPGPPNVERADALFIGNVTGERWPDLEVEYLDGKTASDAAMARGYPMLVVRVVQRESLKGNAPQIVEAISPCALPLKLRDRVLVERTNGEYRAYPAEFSDGERAVRDALRNR